MAVNDTVYNGPYLSNSLFLMRDRDSHLNETLGQKIEVYFNNLENAECTSGRIAKMTSLARMVDMSRGLTRWMFYRTFDWRINYYLTLPSTVFHAVQRDPHWWDNPANVLNDFLQLDDLLNDMSARKVSGGSAKTALIEILMNFPVSVRKWLIRMIHRDLRCGMAFGTWVTVFPDDIPVFGVQLCNKYGGSIDMEKPYIIEPKLDGLRGIIIKDHNGVVEALSRNGKPLYNTEAVASQLPNGSVYDGEFFSDTWAKTVSAVKTKNGDPDKVRFKLFDMLSIEEWQSQKFKDDLYARKRSIAQLALPDGSYVEKVFGIKIFNAEDVMHHAKNFHSQGYEGGVLKDLNAPYQLGYVDAWLKVKFTVTEDFKVLDAVEGQGRNKGRLGAFIVETKHGVKCNVGGGYCDADRIAFWENRDLMVGTSVIEVEFQEYTPEGSLRFPEFQRLRFDKE